MKIAVEIPDVIYKKLINDEIHFGSITSKNIFNYVKNGIPIKTSEKSEEEDEFSILDKLVKCRINKVLKNIKFDITLQTIPESSDEYDYEAKWLNRGLRIASEVIDKYKTDIDELDQGNGMTREEAIKILKDKIKTMEHGAVCCNYGIDKDAFTLAIQALEQEA